MVRSRALHAGGRVKSLPRGALISLNLHGRDAGNVPSWHRFRDSGVSTLVPAHISDDDPAVTSSNSLAFRFPASNPATCVKEAHMAMDETAGYMQDSAEK